MKSSCLSLCALLIISLFLLSPIVLPFSFLFNLLDRFKSQSLNSFFKLETELQSIWRSESSIKALEKLRTIRQQLLEHEHDRLLKGIYIAPYGLFKFHEYHQILWLLYHYEMSHAHWHEADMVCDEILELMGVEASRLTRNLSLTQEWIVNKAKVLEKLEGITAAQHYLLQYLDPDSPENQVNTYFYELRKNISSDGTAHPDNSKPSPQQMANTEKIEVEKKHSEMNKANALKQTKMNKKNIVEFPRKSGQKSQEEPESPSSQSK